MSPLLTARHHRALQREASSDAGTANVASRLVHYPFLMVRFGIALQTLGMNVGVLFAAGAFFAAALGFAMQMSPRTPSPRDPAERAHHQAGRVQDTATNYTLRDSLIRVRASVGVSCGSDMALVMKVLREAAEAVPRRVTEMEPLVLMTGQ